MVSWAGGRDSKKSGRLCLLDAFKSDFSLSNRCVIDSYANVELGELVGRLIWQRDCILRLITCSRTLPIVRVDAFATTKN